MTSNISHGGLRYLIAVCFSTACVACIAADAGDASVKKIMTASFHDKGQATAARLDQDRTQKLCSAASTAPVSPQVSKEVLAVNLATIRYPADGQYEGDWKKGEEIAQSGTGKQFSDDPGKPSGGNCYACHQLTKQEIAYGNLGPSLYNYGTIRGNTEAIKKYTWGKIFNSEAFSACSTMPRFGHMRILTEAQMKDVESLLLDPNSPVNH